MSLSWLPNALTIARCLLAVLSAGAVIAGERLSQRLNSAIADWQAAGAPTPGSPGYPDILAGLAPGDLLFWPLVAFGAFMLATLTDFFDGVLARALNAASAFGAWLDPIADKLLVGLVFAALAITSRSLWLMAPAAVIITRDAYITWLRAKLGGGTALPVMTAAKWKTGVEMGALALLLSLPLTAAISHNAMVLGTLTVGQMTFLSIAIERVGITLAWIAAGLSVWTGMKYWRASKAPLVPISETFE
ncbi:MAG: CDP-alcohol phosphatidyltransferase family protein [Pseudomonadota bacterium]